MPCCITPTTRAVGLAVLLCYAPSSLGSVVGSTSTCLGFATPRRQALYPSQQHSKPPFHSSSGAGSVGKTDARAISDDSSDKIRSDGVTGDNKEKNKSAKGSKRKVVALTTLASFVAVTLSAKLGFLSGPARGNNASFLPYSNALIERDLGSSLLCAILGAVFVKLITRLAASGKLESRDSRKLIHTLSAPLFMLLWPLFSAASGARYFAGITPLANTVRLAIASSGTSDEAELASAISRSGDAKEAIGGPFFYCLVLLFATTIFWHDSMVGIVAVSTMAAGDGLADLIGRRFGKGNKWSFSKSKSIAGSLAFVLGATTCSSLLAWWFGYTGTIVLPFALAEVIRRITCISALCAIVELIPVVDDNWSVPFTAALFD